MFSLLLPCVQKLACIPLRFRSESIDAVLLQVRLSSKRTVLVTNPVEINGCVVSDTKSKLRVPIHS